MAEQWQGNGSLSPQQWVEKGRQDYERHLLESKMAAPAYEPVHEAHPEGLPPDLAAHRHGLAQVGITEQGMRNFDETARILTRVRKHTAALGEQREAIRRATTASAAARAPQPEAEGPVHLVHRQQGRLL